MDQSQISTALKKRKNIKIKSKKKEARLFLS